MTVIKINGQEFEFNFKFKGLREFCRRSGKSMKELAEITSDLNYTSMIASIGTGKTEEDIDELLEADGTWEAVQGILNAYNTEVVQFLSPNSQSQTS